MKTNHAHDLLTFIRRSPSCFHATENFRAMLLAEGCTELCEAEKWDLQSGGKYFVCRNGSSLLAFRVPKSAPSAFVLAAAHSDAKQSGAPKRITRRSGSAGGAPLPSL